MDPLVRPEYDRWRGWIQTLRNQEIPWDRIDWAGKDSEAAFLIHVRGLCAFSDFPSLGADDASILAAWRAIVAAKRKWEEEAARHDRLPIVVGPEGTERPVHAPVDQASCWQRYRGHLLQAGWRQAAVDAIEASSLMILRRIRLRTDGAEPIKGMVVGHVQSGKTASMAGLAAMSADWGWNLVIILTGSLENLRQQTERRIFRDLNHPGNLAWKMLRHPCATSPVGDRAQDCHFNEGSRQRHMVVSLKNKARLTSLLQWLNADTGSRRQMRILVIDDEADQGGIDTSPAEAEERSTMNGLIVQITKVKAAAVNYVAYTATPYANFLNEAYEESLYPRDFIVTLPQSDEHFGPRQVFGIDGTDSEGGLGIVNEVSAADVLALKTLHAVRGSAPPDSLVDATCWFLAASAALRALGLKPRPISMLVHTSAQQAHHENVAHAIDTVLKPATQDHLERLIARCRVVWETQTGRLDSDGFKSRFPTYGRLDEVADLPAFDAILPFLREVVSVITPINMVFTDGAVAPQYHRGVHLCIDNCANDGVNHEGEHLRLMYPSEANLAALGFSPAFIVVGGSTLSRGLTIENLVSTYFLRGGSQMDTLMQMGRWFGYRRGLELLPRLWMPDDTRRKFVFMAGVERDLRDDLRRFMERGDSPMDYGPRVRVHPRAAWLRPTAKNRMREASPAAYDYSGANRQTTIFDTGESDPTPLERNITSAEEFLRALRNPVPANGVAAIVWRGVPLERVAGFLRGQSYNDRLDFFTDMEPFIAWCTEHQSRLDAWNVVVAGISPPHGAQPADVWQFGALSVGKVTRTRLVGASNAVSVSIGTLRDPSHLLADAPIPKALSRNAQNSEVARLRAEAGLSNTPQLLLYRIDRNSDTGNRGSDGRAPLAVAADLIGVSIWLPDARPGDQRTSFATMVTVRIPPGLRRDDDDAVDAPAGSP